MEKVIFHVDVNSAYLSWEAVYRRKYRGEVLDLRDIPSAVGGCKPEAWNHSGEIHAGKSIWNPYR